MVIGAIAWKSIAEAKHYNATAPFHSAIDRSPKVLANPQCWSHLEWPVHQELFVGRLDQIRKVRNTVAHFTRDPVKPADVEQLRNFLKLIRKCTA